MKLSDLSEAERLALGGLLRLLVRADGDFTQAEEDQLNAIGETLGGKDQLWKAISGSAQAFATDQEVRRAGLEIQRPEVRALTLSLLEQVAHADGMSPGEEGIVEALRAHWGAK